MLKAWIGAMRLRTLPLALASTICGVSLAFYNGFFDFKVALLTALTTILLQVNSNLANDYGDFLKGTDSEDRLGPERALQSGVISPNQMKNAIWLFSILSLISGIALLSIANIHILSIGILFIAGIAAIYASIKYTVGSNAYGYRGLGDVSVVLFFGVVGVIGSYYLQANQLSILIFLPAITIGCLSAGVLNVNNTRDRTADAMAGKRTLAVILGAERARLYQIWLLTTAVLAITFYALINFTDWQNWIFLLAIPLFILNGFKVYSIRDDRKLDPYLKQLALSTFLMSVLLAVGVIL